MPRATQKAGRLYTPQIMALQTLLRLTQTDERIPAKDKEQISTEVEHLTSVLSKAQATKPAA